MRVPFEPTAFPSGPHVYLMYELHLTNFMPMPVSLSRIDVIDADAGTFQPIATFEAAQLQTMLQPLGGRALSDPKERLVIADGQSTIAFMSVAFDRGSHIPDRLLHRVITAYAPEEGAVISTHHTELRVLGPPVEGADWLAEDGPSNDEDNHHRRGVVILDGQPVDSRRFAIDWKQVKDGAAFSGEARDMHSYYPTEKGACRCRRPRCHRQRRTSRERPRTRRRVPPRRANYIGNGGRKYNHARLGWRTVCLLHAFAAWEFARKSRGSCAARASAGTRWRFGDAREPHLHFEVTTSSKLLAGEGVPYLIDRYSGKAPSSGKAELHTHELPLDKSVVIFEEEPR